MGDRCSVSIWCRREDQEEFRDVAQQLDDEHETWVRLWDDEVNYAGHSELEGIAKKGIPFVTSHGAGGTYPEGCYAAADGEMACVVSYDGTPLVRYHKDGSINQEDQAEAYRYWRLHRKAWQYLGNEPLTEGE